MITSSADFNNTLTELSQMPDVSFSVLDRKMSVDTYNDTMNQIEEDLDRLIDITIDFLPASARQSAARTSQRTFRWFLPCACAAL